MQKTDLYYIQHMLEYSEKILRLAEHHTRASYEIDEAIQASFLHWLQVIGEAARHVSEDIKFTNPQIPWHAIIGMRNRIVHDYLGIDNDIVWETVINRIPELAKQLEALIENIND